MKKTVATAAIAAGTLILGSPALIELLGRWEGKDRTVYADKLAGGLPTACNGITKHTSPLPVVVGDVWSEEQCERVLKIVTTKTQISLAECLDVAPSQNAFDALSSHAHNFGYPRTCASVAVGLFNAGKPDEGCRALAWTPAGKPNWSVANGSFVPGLHNRRRAEMALCLKP